jgi:FkbM family methyltransferase
MNRVSSLARKSTKAARLMKDPNGRRGLRTGVAMTLEHIPALSPLTPQFIIDVGANKGQFSLLCRSLFPQAPIAAFEPLQEPIEKFQSLFVDDPKVTLHKYAIGNSAGTQDIHVSKKEDSSSLLPIGEMQSQIFPGTQSVGAQTVKVAPLTDFFQYSDLNEVPTLLKIDVQGFELEVLQGCGDLINCIDWCYVECSYRELYIGQPLVDDVIAFLHPLGFHLKGVFGQHIDQSGEAVQADFLFERQTN